MGDLPSRLLSSWIIFVVAGALAGSRTGSGTAGTGTGTHVGCWHPRSWLNPLHHNACLLTNPLSHSQCLVTCEQQLPAPLLPEQWDAEGMSTCGARMISNGCSNTIIP